MEKFDKTNYNRKFNAENYDRLYVTVPRGQKEFLTEHAKSQNESLNSFVNRAVIQTVDRDIDEATMREQESI